MTLLGTIHRLFLHLAMLAVVISPVSIGLASSAMASSGATMMEGIVGATPGMQMAEDMPCCHEQQPVKPDCAKACPLSLVCTTSVFAHAPDSHDWSFAISWLSHRYDLIPTSQMTSAHVEPPARPPKA
ncbi:hypothetical protein ACC761_30600 [Rhizobium ruizarguesonis]